MDLDTANKPDILQVQAFLGHGIYLKQYIRFV